MSNDTELGALLSMRATDVVDHLDLPTDLLGSIHTAHRRHRRNRMAGSAFSVAVVLAGLGIGAVALAGHEKSPRKIQVAAKTAPISYHNARFGYSVVIPGQPNAVLPLLPPLDEGGQEWWSKDDTVRIEVHAVNNTKALSPAADLQALEASYARRGVRLVGHSIGGHVVMITGTYKGQVGYERDVVKSHVIYTLSWNYLIAKKSTYDPMVTSSVHSFKPGPNHAG
jgi:hypothetical protein